LKCKKQKRKLNEKPLTTTYRKRKWKTNRKEIFLFSFNMFIELLNENKVMQTLRQLTSLVDGIERE
jgi:hypothetical protein